MIINSLTLENFKSHRNTKIEFNENISLILGSNGAGKSSILEAISYSFFKEFNGTVDNLMRKAAEENDIVKKMEVTVEFTHDAKQYKLRRGKTKSKNIATLYLKENDSYVFKCDGDTNVTHEIESILNLDSKSFLNAVYIKQGDITDLIEKKPSERKELISKLLNIDSLERAYEEIKNLIDLYKEKLIFNESKLSDKEKIESDIETIESDIEKNTKNLNEIKPLNEELKEKVKKIESEVTQLEIDKTKHDSLIETLKIIEESFKNSNNQKEKYENKLKEIEDNEEIIKKLEKKVESLPHLEELNETKNILNQNNEKIVQIQKEITEIDNNIEQKNTNKESYEDFERLNEEINKLREKRKTISEEYLTYNSIKARIKDKEEKHDRLKNEIQKASAYATELFGGYYTSFESIENKVHDEKEKTETYIEKLTTQINENNKNISIFETEIKNTRKSLVDLEHTEDTCPICQSEISHEKHEELSEQYKSNILNKELKIEELNNANKKQDKTLKEKQEFMKQINKINIDVLREKNDEYLTLHKEIPSLQSSIPEDYKNDEMLKKVDAEIEEKEKLSDSLKEKADAYTFAVKRLNELDDIDVLNKNVKELNDESKNLKSKCEDIVRKYAVKDNLNQQIKYLKTENDRLNKLKGMVQNKEDISNNIKSLNNEIGTLNEKINNTESEIKNLNYDSKNYDNKKETCRQNKLQLEENNKNITRLETEINKDQENISHNQKKLKELEEISVEQNNLKDYIKTLETLREMYSKDGVQKDLREGVRPLIEKETLDIFNKFDFDYTSLTLDSDYNITLHNKNEELNLDMVSGGEKIVIALALRLGIAKVLSKNKTDLLILDEPTIHLDEERRSRLIEIIGKIKFVPQMLVITHDDEMEILSNNIIKIQKQNGISSIDHS